VSFTQNHLEYELLSISCHVGFHVPYVSVQFFRSSLGTQALRKLAITTGLGIRGTQVKSSIQDIVDEVAPIKKAPLWV
jgi:hypothetical protein